jgi:ureidoglycolate lyase
MAAVPIKPELLTKSAFTPFGDVIETDGADLRIINGGSTGRYHDLMNIDASSQGGKPILSIFRGQPFAMPIAVRMVERHPLGSQAFIPMGKFPFLVVVAADKGGTPQPPRAFLATGGQGVNYGRNVWHHPLLSLEIVCDFAVIDRSGQGNNLEEYFYRGEGFTVVPT